jgi:hypothetical protein
MKVPEQAQRRSGMTHGRLHQYDPGHGVYREQTRLAALRRQWNTYGVPIAAVGLLAASTAGCSGLTGSSSPASADTVARTAQQTAQPETEAGARDAASQFYALYSASQWPQAWAFLSPASQHAAPEPVYVAVHEGCPPAMAGVARVIKSVTMAGATAVITETASGAIGALGSVTDAWTYSGGRWGLAMSQDALASYAHGSAAADLAALKASGECAGAQPLQTLQTAAPATVQPTAVQTLATFPTVPPSALPTASPLPPAPLATASS